MNKINKVFTSIATSAAVFALNAQQAFAQIQIIPKSGQNNSTSNFGNLTSLTLPRAVGVSINLLLLFASVSFFIMLLVGGGRWIVSSGDKTNTQNARQQITAALVGLVIVFSGWIILSLIGQIFGLGNLQNLDIPTI